jgi:GNAT superfamily N-acetyltransferase
MDQVRVRPADLSDLVVLLDFEQAIIEAERPFDDTIRTGADVRYYDLAGLIASRDAEVLVAELNSEIVGSGYARIERSDPYVKHVEHSYLGFMYVVPEHRGKGINKKIIEALEAWSRAQGVTEMQLEVYVDNLGAIRAYEKSGYKALILTMRKGLTEVSEKGCDELSSQLTAVEG